MIERSTVCSSEHRVRSSIIDANLIAVGDIDATAGISIKERRNGDSDGTSRTECRATRGSLSQGDGRAERACRTEGSTETGSTDLVDVLQDAETKPTTGSMRVSDLLGALPTVGKSQARQIMTEIGRRGGLPPNQSRM